LRIGELRKTKQSPTFFLFVMVAVVIVSAVANIAEGFTTVQGEQITVYTIRRLDPLQAIIGLAATGLISLIVLALAEIAGADVETAVKQVERERKSSSKEMPTNARPEKPEKASTTDQPPSIEQARAAKAAQDATSKEQALQALMDYMSAHPTASLSDVGRAIGRSKTTVANYIRELEQGGQIERNGRDWQIKEQ
jgi:hypothetical protein